MAETPITPGVVSDWVLEVAPYATGTAPAEYTKVRGITDFTPPGVEKNLEDDADFDSEGWASQVATGLEYEISGTVKVPRASMAADPGQAILKAAGRGLAESGIIHFRTYKRGGTEGVSGTADCTFTEGGGKRTDLTAAEFTLSGRGALVDYEVESGAAALSTLGN